MRRMADDPPPRHDRCSFERWEAEGLADATRQMWGRWLAANGYIVWISARRVGPGRPGQRGLKWGVMLTRDGVRIGGSCGTWHGLCHAIALRRDRDDSEAGIARVKVELAGYLPWPLPTHWEGVT